MKTWYQIDRRKENDDLERYDMVKSTNLKNALREHLGNDFNEYTITTTRQNGKIILKAECPETSGYIEVFRCQSNK